MRIICPTCSSHYEVELDKIAAQGQLVRCARCREVWLVRAPAQATVAGTPTATPVSPVRPGAAPTVSNRAEVVDFAAARTRLRSREAPVNGSRRAGSLSSFAVGAVLLSSLLSLYAFRESVVERLPATAAAYAAVGLPVGTGGLALRDVHSVIFAEGGESVLTLQGRITNLKDETVTVPKIAVSVRGKGQVALYSWTTTAPKTTLARGESVAFTARLASPPTGGNDVRVSFAAPDRTTMAALP